MIRIFIVLCLIAIALWAIFDSKRVSDGFEEFIQFLEDNPILAPFILIVVYAIATVLFLPGLILTLGAGFAFNEAYGNAGIAILVGSIAVWIGAMLGSIAAMFIGRYLLRNWVAKKAKKFKVFGAIDQALEKEGFKLTFLLRLSPVIPFNLFNYMMGITKVRFSQYSLGGLGMIPGTIVYVYFGTTVSNISDAARGEFEGGVLQLVLIIVGSILAFIGVCYVSYVARKEVKKVLKKHEEENAVQKMEDQEAHAQNNEDEGENNQENKDENQNSGSRIENDNEVVQKAPRELQTENVDA